MHGSVTRVSTRTTSLVVGALAAALLVGGQVGAAHAADGYTVDPAPNPDLMASCGLDVVLALDTSYSIVSAGSLEETRAAALGLVKSFQDKSTRVGIVRFSDTATKAVPLTLATSQTTAKGGVHENAVNHYFSGVATDWQAAAKAIKSTFDGATRPPGTAKLLILLTDGAPNKYTDAQGKVVGPPANSFASVDAATPIVNQLKAAGVHVLGVGTGKALDTGPEKAKYKGALEQVSGTDVTDAAQTPPAPFNALTTDVVLNKDLGALQTQFRQLAAGALDSPSCSFLAMAPSPSKVRRGASFDVTGRLTSSGEVALAGQNVTVQSRAIGAAAWSALGVRKTDAQGRFSIKQTATSNREYRGVYAGSPPHAAVTSGTTRVTVAPKVKAKASVRALRVGTAVRATFTGKVTPKRATTRVFLEKRINGSWLVQAKRKVHADGTFRIKRTISERSRWRFATKASTNFGVGRSKAIKIRL